MRDDMASQMLLCRCESPAETALLRALLSRPDVRVESSTATWQGMRVTVQHPAWQYRVDVALVGPGIRIAVEVDGVTFHPTDQRALSREHLRQRRLAFGGWTVVRFTARDVFANAARCWNQVSWIVDARRRRSRRHLFRAVAASAGVYRSNSLPGSATPNTSQSASSTSGERRPHSPAASR